MEGGGQVEGGGSLRSNWSRELLVPQPMGLQYFNPALMMMITHDQA